MTGTVPTAVAGPTDVEPAGVWQRIDRRDAARTVFVIVCAAAAGAAQLAGAAWPVLAGIAVLGLVTSCWPIAVEAWGDIRARRMSMELSMLIAIAAAAAIGQWVTSLVIAAFVLAAEILEDLSMDRGRDALSGLMAFLPTAVEVLDGDHTVTTPLDELRPGQTVVVAPGGAIPVDGSVVSGRSSLDQSRITGESLPVDVQPGSGVYAGSVNQSGALQVRVEHVGAESSYGRIVQAVRDAQTQQAPVQRLADRLAAWIVYVAVAAAVVTYVLTRDLQATISVVVVAGACGVAAGTPLAVLAGIARVARTGAFVKGGSHLETLSTVDTVIFDKTGTLTTGTPEVTGTRAADGTDPARLLGLAAAAEWYSEHPLGVAIVAHARAVGVPAREPDTFDYLPGLGVAARIDGHIVTAGNRRHVPDAPTDGTTAGTAVHVAVDGRYAGCILLADTVRDSAPGCLDRLHAAGIRTVMLTGDTAAVARDVAIRVGVGDVHADLLPDDKLAVIAAERAAGHRVAMVGDGVNDAPALAAADVGVAIGSGTAIARESADVILISTDLTDLARTIGIARRARHIIMVNFAGTLVVDLVGIILAGLGVLGPVGAAIVHVGSESAFILNSARLIPPRARRNTTRTPLLQPADKQPARP